jgi:magnesium-transporting ATPase (P-type)
MLGRRELVMRRDTAGTWTAAGRVIEAAGRTDVLCFDKTGTLSQGRISLVAVAADGHSRPLGSLRQDQRAVLAAALRATPRPHNGGELAHGTARDAVRRLAEAGVHIVMITGDHPGTAESMAVGLGVLDGRRVVTGAELDAMDDPALDKALPDVGVVARGTPVHKVRVVQAFQRLGRTVAMTGDGANDAPAPPLIARLRAAAPWRPTAPTRS